MTDFIDVDSDELDQITVLRFYCLGTDQSREDDDQYEKDVSAEIASIDAALAEIGQVGTIGIGGAGDDFVRAAALIGALYSVLKMPGAAHEAATHLRNAWRCIRRATRTTWRVTREALVIECCEQLREELGVDFVPGCERISVARFPTDEFDFQYIPEAHFLITIPHQPSNRTYVFQADTDFNVTKIATLHGLPRGMHQEPA